MRFLDIDKRMSGITSITPIKEHACRSFWDIPYERGLKTTRDNTQRRHDHETPRTFYFRTACREPDNQYREDVISLSGFKLRSGENGDGLRAHPLSDIAAEIVGYYKQFIKSDLLDAPHALVCGLSLEMDTSMAIADVTDQADPNNEEDKADRIYGHRNGDDYHVKPWCNISQHSAFLDQINSVRQVISGTTSQNIPPQNEDIVNFVQLLLFHVLVQDFSELFTTTFANGLSILEGRMKKYSA